ncbi:MAG: hypothetical protein HY287_06315 [Planctomycetes bacterium]|nr:hypothetical protein [Planctomycetota bacterium]MBI3833927.1 hypothetical protein [Planctomycetota bacterium]
MLRYQLKILAIAVFHLGSVANAQLALFWTNPSGGSAADALNWNPTAVPRAVDYLYFNIPEMYTVQFDKAVPDSQSVSIGLGNVTFELSAPHEVLTDFMVGAIGDATITLAQGTFTLGPNVANSHYLNVLGTSSGSHGTMNVISPTASLIGSGSRGLSVGSNNGTGTLNVIGGGQVNLAGLGVVHGNANIIGGDTSTGVRSTLRVFGLSVYNDSSLIIGEGGSVIVANEVFAHDGGQLFIASSAELGSTLTASDLTVSNSNAFFNYNNSETVIEIGAGAEVNVADSTTVYQNGTLRLLETCVLRTRNISISQDSTLTHVGGVLIVDGGGFDTEYDALPAVNSTAGFPHLELRHGAFATAQNRYALSTNALAIGTTGYGLLTVQDAATIELTQGDGLLGQAFGSLGELNIESGSLVTLAPSSVFIVGDKGQAVLNVVSADLSTGTVYVGKSSIGYGEANVVGEGGNWVIHGGLFVGCEPNSGVGSGRVAVSSGSTLSASSTLLMENSQLDVASGARIDIAGPANIRGVLTLNAGELAANSMEVTEDGMVTGSGSILAKLQLAGTLRPHVGTMSDTGVVAVTGDVGFADEGTYLCRVNSAGPGGADRLEISGTAELHGRLRIELGSENDLQVCQKVEVMTFHSTKGNFDRVELPFQQLRVVIGDDGLSVAVGPYADIYADGSVDLRDWALFQNKFGCSGPCFTDFTQDSRTDNADNSFLVSQLGTTCP